MLPHSLPSQLGQFKCPLSEATFSYALAQTLKPPEGFNTRDLNRHYFLDALYHAGITTHDSRDSGAWGMMMIEMARLSKVRRQVNNHQSKPKKLRSLMIFASKSANFEIRHTLYHRLYQADTTDRLNLNASPPQLVTLPTLYAMLLAHTAPGNESAVDHSIDIDINKGFGYLGYYQTKSIEDYLQRDQALSITALLCKSFENSLRKVFEIASLQAKIELVKHHQHFKHEHTLGQTVLGDTLKDDDQYALMGVLLAKPDKQVIMHRLHKPDQTHIEIQCQWLLELFTASLTLINNHELGPQPTETMLTSLKKVGHFTELQEKMINEFLRHGKAMPQQPAHQ